MTTRPQHGDAFPRCLLVRAGYELVESSTRLYSSSILPSSAFRPLGTYPPCSSPVSIAKSSPARSAPVWPPDMILRIILSNSSLQRFSVASGSSRSTLARESFQMMLSHQRGSNKVLSLCPYKRGVPRAPCQKRKISTVRLRWDSAMR